MSETVLPRGARERLAAVTMPSRIATLPRDKRGYPIPAFIDRKADKADGEPDFRIMNPHFLGRCVKQRRCWICGQILGRYQTFTIGPMCAVNRNTAEPPGHLDCAIYSARVCPFLSNPDMRRIDHNMPDTQGAGIMIPRNPGVTCLWTTTRYRVWQQKSGGVLFDIGEPTGVQWWAHGRPATRAEIEASINSGMPLLRAQAEMDPRKDEALEELQRYFVRAQQYLPAA